eukprot:9295639-Prorocentrum_lima.AAC.2
MAVVLFPTHCAYSLSNALKCCSSRARVALPCAASVGSRANRLHISCACTGNVARRLARQCASKDLSPKPPRPIGK